jgi:uncharacterized protein (TIGR03435 family)
LGFQGSGSLQARGITLKQLIQLAYDLGYFGVDQRLVGGPKWMGTARFDLDAKCDDDLAHTFQKAPIEQLMGIEQTMLRELLADRFKLRLHHETRQLPVLLLVPARGGPRLTVSAVADSYDPFGPDGPPGNWHAKGVSMEELASNLSALPESEGRIVVDRTGLKGKYDFKLKWTPEPAPDAPAVTADNGLRQDATAPSLQKALEEQLGLKFESSKEPVDVLVIDAAEMPSAN